jgi:two-component system, NtrC family, response regulator AtoC
VRQLRNLVDKLVATVHEPLILQKHLPEPSALEALAIAERPPPKVKEIREPSAGGAPVGGPGQHLQQNLADEIRELEKRRIHEALEAAEGVRVKAAALIGMPLRTFVAKLKRYGLS